MKGLFVAIVGAAAVLLAGCATSAMPPPQRTDRAAALSAADVDHRIATLRRQTRDNPRLYPAQAQLAAACLEKAKATLDPAWVRCARNAARASLDVQQTYEGFAALAGVEAFSHRFETCLDAALHADGAYPEGGTMLALRVECLIASGREDEARTLLATTPVPVRTDGSACAFDFYRSLASAALARADADRVKAVAAYRDAAASAAQQRAVSLESWALVQAAGLLIDDQRPEDARPLLEAARAVGPPSLDLEGHEAELLAASGRDSDALAAFERLMTRSPLPDFRVRAWRLATKLSRPDLARRLFREAEAAMRAPIDAGEVYTLDMLANLYLEAGVHADEARRLALRNIEFKKDAAARRLVHDVEAAGKTVVRAPSEARH